MEVSFIIYVRKIYEWVCKKMYIKNKNCYGILNVYVFIVFNLKLLLFSILNYF